MTSLEIMFVLAGIPLGIMIVLALLTLGPDFRRTPRYRPGQQWQHPPVWWTADPEALRGPNRGGRDRGGRSRGGIGAQHQTPSAPHGGCRGDW
ncbi:MAG TPA: hypothetical protein VGJ13_02355 [Pseudonocardiaceae bacterium]